MTYEHLQYTIRYDIRTSAIYDPLWHTNIFGVWSVMAYEHLQCMIRYGILTSVVYDPLWHTNIYSIRFLMAYEHVQYTIRYDIRTSTVYYLLWHTNICSIDPLWHTNICSMRSVMAYEHLRYMVRYGILPSAVYDPLCSCPSVVLVLVCGVGANSAQHSSNNWNFISRECRGTIYLHYTNKPWTPARLNMSVVTNMLKIRIIKNSHGALSHIILY